MLGFQISLVKVHANACCPLVKVDAVMCVHVSLDIIHLAIALFWSKLMLYISQLSCGWSKLMLRSLMLYAVLSHLVGPS